MRYFIFIFFLLLLSSCGGETVSENACSPSNVRGKCENTNQYCFTGVCINNDAECEKDNILAPCQNKQTHYCKKISDDTYKCLPFTCSLSKPNGFCENEQTCVNGDCIDVCSELKPNGYCLSEDVVSDIHICIDGLCYLKTEECSETNPTGVCSSGFVCNSKTCKAECSVTNLEGACTEGKICSEGYCLATNNLCNEFNSNGECPPGKNCYENKCQYSCSESHEDGYCTDKTKMCRDGRCQYNCTQTRPNGVCINETHKCMNGECIPPCSLDDVNGYCDVNMLCISGTCEYLCSSSHLDGYCDEGTACIDGTCQYHCSGTHMDGYCEGDYQICKGGVCVDGCSPENVAGPCERSDFYCDSQLGICVEHPCGPMNLDGPCSTAGQRCISGICKSPCSAAAPDGYCQWEDFVCYSGECIELISAPCSTQFPNGICEVAHTVCVNGTCLEEECSPTYPTGRCPNGKYCDGGTCVAPQICSDGRPLDGQHGACCQTSDDCGGSICIEDDTEGFYCLDYIDNDCVNDFQCNDPFSIYGNEQEYFCVKSSYIWNNNTYVPYSSCQRLSDSCSASLSSVRTKNMGEPCDVEQCGNAECKNGLTCNSGFCLPTCNILIGEENNPDCPSINGQNLDCISGSINVGPYHYSGNLVNSLSGVNECANICNSNNDCFIPNTECNANFPGFFEFKYKHICSEKSITGRDIGQFCTANEECKNNICNVSENKCSAYCDTDDDCQINGLNGYCNFDYYIQFGNGMTYEGIQRMGTCLFLDSTSTLQAECSHKSDCAALGSNYYCLPKFNENSVSGECGILDRARSYRGIGLPCDNSTFYCETGKEMCLESKCYEYCTATSQCGVNSYCEATKLKDEVTLSIRNNNNLTIVSSQPALWGGICKPKTGSMTQCINSLFPCNNNETCRYNKSKMISSDSEVEYLCMVKETEGSVIGAVCNEHSDCQTGICHPDSKICTTACKTNVQCEDIFTNGYCKLDGIAVVESLNPANNVYAGLCDIY